MALPDLSARRLKATSPARRWRVDVDTSVAQDGSVWTPVMGRTDTTPNNGTVTLQNDSDYDSGGFSSQSATGIDWGLTMTVRRAPTAADPTSYDPGQEFIRGRARQTGPDNTIHVRVYEELGVGNPRVEANEGYAAAAWADAGGEQTALSTATITLTGQGLLLPIPHPAGASSVAPIVTGVRYGLSGSAVPSASGTTAAGGAGLLYIDGSGFTGVTAVVVFGNTVPGGDFDATSANLIVVKAPAHAAGTGDVVVTTPGGSSGTSAASKVTFA